jgi:DNA polymerase-3 subunit delta'
MMAFSNVLGQERAKLFLAKVMAREKIPHAYLFTGIPGIGKTTTAMALAMALNCRQPIDGEGCGVCVTCRQLKSRNFPDFVSIRPQGQNIRIDQVRDFQRTLGFAPVSARYRVSVIHRAETMTAEAANAFLKTLEEPPPGNILILNTTESLDLLPTIVSRCQRVPFQPLPVRGMTDWLIGERDLNEETATILAMISEGSLGRALAMMDNGFLDRRQEWLLRLIKLPGLSEEKAFEMALECVKEDRKAGNDMSETWEGGVTDMLAVWETWYRDLLVIMVGGVENLIVNADFSRELKNIAKNFRIENLWESIFVLDRSQRDLRQMRNTKLVMEYTVLRLNGLTAGVM